MPAKYLLSMGVLLADEEKKEEEEAQLALPAFMFEHLNHDERSPLSFGKAFKSRQEYQV